MRILHLLRVTLCATFIAGAHASDSVKAPSSIVGKWSGKDDRGTMGAFVFSADGTADLLKDGVSLKETVVKDQGAITYRFDPSVTPITLDIVLTMTNRPVRTMRGIVEFLSPEKMRVRMPRGDSRPLDFSGPQSEIIVVERVADEKKKA
jgi:hypothetical protein